MQDYLKGNVQKFTLTAKARPIDLFCILTGENEKNTSKNVQHKHNQKLISKNVKL
jgi:hypothetical protein